jgi:hypothetical protein
MDGDLPTGRFLIPVHMTRTGAPLIYPASKSAPISKALEGSWNGELNAGGERYRLVLTMSNQPDGTSSTQHRQRQHRQHGSGRAGLIGTIKMGDITAPLTFQRAATSHE